MDSENIKRVKIEGGGRKTREFVRKRGATHTYMYVYNTGAACFIFQRGE